MENKQVVVHPLVLLSIVDHYNRIARDTRKRVVGILLGESQKNHLDVQNCFAVPFEEDERNPDIWYLDHSYLESMHGMFRKVNAREDVIGWYSTGPKIKANDLKINELLKGYCEDPILLICQVQPKEHGLPISAYHAIEEIKEDGTDKAKKVFQNLQVAIAATEAEEVGVEHLLRDVKDASITHLASEVSGKSLALRGLLTRLQDIIKYLDLVVQKKLPINNDIIFQLQEIINMLPQLNIEYLANSLQVKTNDMMLVIYIASIIRSIIALHNLIDNKEARQHERVDKDEVKNGNVKNGHTLLDQNQEQLDQQKKKQTEN